MEFKNVNVNVNNRENRGNVSFVPRSRPQMNREMPPRDIPLRDVSLGNMPPEEPAGTAKDRDTGFIVKVFDRLIGFSIFALFFGVPLYFTGMASQGVVFEKQIWFYFWLLLGLISWTAKGVISGEMNIRRTPLDIPIIGLWLVTGVSAFFSVDKWHSFWGSFGDPSRGFMSLTAMIIAYYLILSNFNAKRLRLMLGALAGSGIVVMVWTLLAVFNIRFLPEKIASFAPMSLIGSVSGLGAFLSAMAPVIMISVLKLAENEKMNSVLKKALEIFMIAFLLLDMFLILVLYNFIPWAGLFVGISVFLVFILAKIMRPKMSWTWLPMVVFVAVMAVRMIGAVDIVKVNLPVEVSLNYDVSTQIAKESIKNKFALGSGPATFGYDFSLHKPEGFNKNAFYNLRFSQGTGVLMEAVSTLGALGAFFLAVLILSFVSVGFYMLSREKEKNKLYSLGLFSSAIILLVDACGMKMEGTVLLMAVFLGAAAMASIIRESESRKNELSLSLKASPKFALALAFVFMVVSAGVAFLFVFLGKIYVADAYAGMAGRAENEDRIIGRMKRAAQLNNQEGRYYVQLGQYYMALANKEAMKKEEERDMQKIQAYLSSGIVAASQGKELSKNNVSSVESLALVYENAALYVPDALEKAKENYERCLELEPASPVFYDKLGQIKIAQAAREKDAEKKKQMLSGAKEEFGKSIEKKENYAPGYYQLALIHEALGEKDQALEKAQKAASYAPRNPGYLLALGRIYQGKEDYENAEKVYKSIVAINDKSIDGHFYLGLVYEKENKKQEAKNEYKKVAELVGDSSNDLKGQLSKMISNIDQGIANTPETLGLIKKEESRQPQNSEPEIPVEPANAPAGPENQPEGPAAR